MIRSVHYSSQKLIHECSENEQCGECQVCFLLDRGGCLFVLGCREVGDGGIINCVQGGLDASRPAIAGETIERIVISIR